MGGTGRLMTSSDSSTAFTSGWVAELVGAETDGPEVDGLVGLKGLDAASANDVTFLANSKYEALAATTQARVLIAKDRPKGYDGTVLLCDLPYLAMATLAKALISPPMPAGISPEASIDPQATLASEVTVAPLARIDRGATVGSGTVIHSQAFIGRDAIIGENVEIHPGAKVLERCRLGDGVILQAGAVIGSDGFGYAPDNEGTRHKIPQIGIVVLEDHVEIGANTTIDRATFGETRIGKGTKVDNLVQIAHNVETGKDCVIVSQSGIAGSTKLGDRVVAGAQVGIVGHIEVANDVMLGARAALTKTIKGPGVFSGTPAMPHREWLKYSALRGELPSIRRNLKKLSKSLEKPEDSESDT